MNETAFYFMYPGNLSLDSPDRHSMTPLLYLYMCTGINTRFFKYMPDCSFL